MYEKAKFVAVEVRMGSRQVAVAVMLADEYIRLRQNNALGLNNCFVPDEEGAARWNALVINKYVGWNRSGVKIVKLPTMDTKSYNGRWMDFERATCEALGLEHLGYEMTGKVKGYIPDGMDAMGFGWEIKSRRGQYRKGQVKKGL